MADEDPLEVWRAIMGDSDNEMSEFEGFTIDDLAKNDESDIDLDLVVNNDRVLANFHSESDSDRCHEADGGDSDIPLPTAAGPSGRKRQKRSSKKVRDEVTVHWSDQTRPVKPKVCFAGYDGQFREGAQNVKVGVSHDLPVGASQFDFFSLLLPEGLWEKMSIETNKYATQRQELKEDKTWQPSTPQEMKIFIFIQYMFGIHHLPETYMYWSTDPLLRVPAVADVMSRNRFYKINQYFHLNDNAQAVAKGEPGYDPLYKVRPLLDAVLKNSRTHYHPGQDIALDEAMIKFNGRLSFKQYIKGECQICFIIQFQVIIKKIK